MGWDLNKPETTIEVTVHPDQADHSARADNPVYEDKKKSPRSRDSWSSPKASYLKGRLQP